MSCYAGYSLRPKFGPTARFFTKEGEKYLRRNLGRGKFRGSDVISPLGWQKLSGHLVRLLRPVKIAGLPSGLCNPSLEYEEFPRWCVLSSVTVFYNVTAKTR